MHFIDETNWQWWWRIDAYGSVINPPRYLRVRHVEKKEGKNNEVDVCVCVCATCVQYIPDKQIIHT